MRKHSILYLEKYWKSTTFNKQEITMTKPLDTIHHTAIQVKNIAHAVTWYTERFASEIEYQDDSWAMLMKTMLRC
ncbi:hypothetical protein JCM17795_09100 [Galenea microaerophila]